MKRSRKIVGSIFLFLASIATSFATSFAIESGLGLEALLNANPVATLFDANRTAIEITSSGTSTPSSTKTATANLDPSDTFSNNVICTEPDIQNHTIYVCSGVPIEYEVPDGVTHSVPNGTEYIWNVLFPNGSNDNVTNENVQNNYQRYFRGTTLSNGLINTSTQPQTVVYNVTPRSGICTGEAFLLTVIVEPAVTVLIGNKAESICSGDTFEVIPTDGFENANTTKDIVPANMKYTWEVDDIASVDESDETTPKASISQTLTNTSSSAKTVTYTVTPLYGTDYTCSGPTFQVSVTVNPRASITTQPESNTVCLGGTTPPLTVDSDGTGTPTYQWFRNDDNSNTIGGDLLTGETSDSFTPSTTDPGVTYYYVELTFGTTGPCTTVISNPAKIEVVGTASITTQPEALQSICIGGTTTLTVDITGGTGTPTYQWYSNDKSSTDGDIISGANKDFYTPPASTFTTAGDYYYYVVITQNGSTCGATLTSDVSTVRVVADPIIKSQPVTSQILCQGATPTNLTATIDGGIGSTATYQWFKNTATNSNSGGDRIDSNGTDATYTPLTTDIGTTYYYVEVTQSASGCKVVSNTATVEIVAPPTILTQPSNAVACQGGTSPDLKVTFSGNTGALTYQWFKNTTTNYNTGGIRIDSNGTDATYTPLTTETGTTYYYVEVTQSASGCKVVSNTATVQIVDPPTVSTQPVNNTVCLGGTTPALTVTYSDGTGTPTYQWFRNDDNSNTGGDVIDNASTASYIPPTDALGITYYYVKLAFGTGGCSTITSDPAKIEVVDSPTFDIQPVNSTVCLGGTTPALTVAYSDGTGSPTYQWFRNDEDSNTGGDVIDNATTASYIPPTDALGITYYYVELAFGTGGCSTITSDPAKIEVVPQPTVSTQPVNSTVCLGGTTPALTVAYSDGTGTPTYQWFRNDDDSNTGGDVIDNATTASYTPPTNALGITYYYVKLTFGTGGCSTITSDPAKIEVEDPPTFKTQPDPLRSICVGGEVPAYLVEYEGGIGTPTYQWYFTPTPSSPGGTAIDGATTASFTPPVFTTAGDYYYYAAITLSAPGCSSTIFSDVATVRVVADPVIASQPVTSQILCQGATPTNLTATINGGIGSIATYQWFKNTTTNSNSGGTQITPNGTDATYTPPTTEIGTTYYYVEITQSASGCKVVSNTATVQIVTPPTFETQPLNAVACQGGTTPDLKVTLRGTTGTLTYQWFSNTTNSNTLGAPIQGETKATFAPPTTTTTIGSSLYYYVEVTQSPSGCKIVSNTATIQIVAQPAITSQPTDAAVCQNGITPDLTVAYSGGTGTPTYQWFSNTTNLNTGGTALAGKTAATFTPPTTAVGTLYYYVQLSFATGGCTTITSNPAKIEVVDVILTEVVANRRNILCFGDATGNISVQGSGGIKKYTFTITGTDYLGTAISLTSGPVNLDLFSFATLKAGTYVLSLTDQTGCQKSSTPIILTQPLAPLQITDDTSSKSITCFGKKDGSISLTVTGGTAPYNIQWAHGPQGPTLNNLEKGVYSVVITDAGGCKVDKQFVINEPQALDLSSSVTDALDCVDPNSGSITINPLGGTPPYTYTWSNGSTTQNLSAIGPGSYSLELVDANGCRVLKQFTITRPLPLEVSVAQTTVRVCEPRGLKSNFKVNVKGGVPPYTITWNKGTATNAGLVMDTQELGEFIVTVKDARGCIQTKRMEVLEVDPPTPEFDYKSESFDLNDENLVNFEVQFKNLSTGKYKDVSWDFGDSGTSTEPDPTHKYVKEGTYTVVLRLKDLDGCIVSFTKTIVITDYYLKFPNVFTPNKDGINDHYFPKMLYISAIEVFIMNKFGEVLYESKDLEAKGWDGLYKGEQVPIGNYVCKVRHTTLDGRVIDQSSVFYLGR